MCKILYYSERSEFLIYDGAKTLGLIYSLVCPDLRSPSDDQNLRKDQTEERASSLFSNTHLFPHLHTVDDSYIYRPVRVPNEGH